MEEIFVGWMFTAPPWDVVNTTTGHLCFAKLHGALMLPNNSVSKAQKAMLRAEVSAAALEVDMP